MVHGQSLRLIFSEKAQKAQKRSFFTAKYAKYANNGESFFAYFAYFAVIHSGWLPFGFSHFLPCRKKNLFLGA